LITRNRVKCSNSNPYEKFEIEIDESSPVVGKSIKELNFWHATGATIIAIRREGNLILSPGPYAVLSLKDIIVFIGDQSAVNTVTEFVSPKKQL
jgi:K+/H+ antiporter YhaU regulatory subunit KhtT